MRTANTVARRVGIGTSDVLLTAALLVVTLFAVLVLPPHWIEGNRVDTFGVVLIVLSTLPVLVRRRHPVLALAMCVPVEVVYHALDYAHEASLPVAVVLIYTVSASTSRLWALVAVGLTSLAVLLTVGLTQDGPPGVEVISPLGWFLVALVTGQAVRIHRAYLAESTERRVVEERLRIARDLHDVLAHNIMVINSHAAVAAHLLDERADDPSLAPIAASLHTVADASSGGRHWTCCGATISTSTGSRRPASTGWPTSRRRPTRPGCRWTSRRGARAGRSGPASRSRCTGSRRRR